jgi:multiple sugar transport system substrate-binding protein
MSLRLTLLALLAVLAAVAAGCGGDDGDDGGPIRGDTITVWSNEFQPDRLNAIEDILASFTKKTGVKTELVAVPEDQLTTLTINAAAAGELPDVVFATPVGDSHTYATEELFDVDAAQQVVDKLGEDTFSKQGIALVSQKGKVTGVPSDGWGQLLLYRKDLFEEAGIDPPKSLDDIRAAAEELNTDEVAGITLATAPSDQFTSETFEHVGLAAGCQLVNDAGEVTFDSPECVEALEWYGDMANNYSVQGAQNVDTTRATYFAGRAAMMFWSPFLLDGMAGLRDDTKPACPECKEDPAFLAKNSGLVGPLEGPSGEPSQFGSVSTFNISVDANRKAAKALVEYMMNEGYTRWLGLSPQGKYPMRLGDKNDPERFVKAWADLDSGVDRKAPLTKFYSQESIDSLGEGAENFGRWGFPQGQGALIGAMSGEQPLADAVAEVVGGADPADVAADTQSTIEEIQAGVD